MPEPVNGHVCFVLPIFPVDAKVGAVHPQVGDDPHAGLLQVARPAGACGRAGAADMERVFPRGISKVPDQVMGARTCRGHGRMTTIITRDHGGV